MVDDLPDEDVGVVHPALSEEVRRHLGRMLAATYEGTPSDATAADRFTNLLAGLSASLDAFDRRTAAEFQAGLLAVVPGLRRFALSLTYDSVAADDLVQDTMLRAWRSRASFKSGTNLEAWTFTIARNQFYSGHRKFAREVQDEDGGYAAKLATVPEQGGRLDLQDLRAALDRLQPLMREALMLVTVQDLSYEEAAAVMDCAIGTVKSRCWRARSQLARMLGYTAAEIGTDAVMSSALGAVG